jgi:hypothetical protein
MFLLYLKEKSYACYTVGNECDTFITPDTQFTYVNLWIYSKDPGDDGHHAVSPRQTSRSKFPRKRESSMRQIKPTLQCVHNASLQHPTGFMTHHIPPKKEFFSEAEFYKYQVSYEICILHDIFL